MTIEGVLLICLMGWIALIMLARDWRFTFTGLAGLALCAGGLLWVGTFVGSTTANQQYSLLVLMIEIITAVCMTAILGLAGLVLPRMTPVQIPEGMLDLSSTVRLAAEGPPKPRWSRDRLPMLFALLGTLIVSFMIPQLLPVTLSTVGRASILLLCAGVVVILTTSSLFDVGVGLLTALYGIRLFYVSIVEQIVLVNLVLLSIVIILVALVASYLAELSLPVKDQPPVLHEESTEMEAAHLDVIENPTHDI